LETKGKKREAWAMRKNWEIEEIVTGGKRRGDLSKKKKKGPFVT